MPQYFEIKKHFSEKPMDQIRKQKVKLKTIWPDRKKYTIHQNLWDAIKAVFKGNLLV